MPNNPKQPLETATTPASSAAPAITPTVVSELDRSQMVVGGKLFAWQRILQKLNDPKLKLENLSTFGYCKSLSFLWGWYTARGKGDSFEKLLADAAACDLKELKNLIIQIKTIEDQTEKKTQAVDAVNALIAVKSSINWVDARGFSHRYPQEQAHAILICKPKLVFTATLCRRRVDIITRRKFDLITRFKYFVGYLDILHAIDTICTNFAALRFDSINSKVAILGLAQ